ncbi:MAG: hypothetical protein CMI30_01785 [Opitutae bacterium]|nr:hypothetical protein [Opitutae bacterium]|tara:strand:- start:6182 stop:7099 length:918 start_codon:yes stop_codon:yes gene_type:complete
MDIGINNYHLDLSAFETNLLKILFYSIPAMILIWRGMRGWHLGLHGKVAALVSIALSLAAAYFLGNQAGYFIPDGIVEDPLIEGLLGNALAGIVAYVCLRLLFTAVLKISSGKNASSFEKTGGMLLGVCEGLLLVFALALVVRWYAEVSEASVLADSTEGVSPEEMLEQETPNLNFISRATLYWNQKVQKDPAGAIIEKIDPVPSDFYDLSKNLMILSRNPKVLERFGQSPEVVEFLDDPTLQNLKSDPKIVKLYKERDFLQLLREKPVQDALKDKEFRQRLEDAGVHEALTRSVAEVRDPKEGD